MIDPYRRVFEVQPQDENLPDEPAPDAPWRHLSYWEPGGKTSAQTRPTSVWDKLRDVIVAPFRAQEQATFTPAPTPGEPPGLEETPNGVEVPPWSEELLAKRQAFIWGAGAGLVGGAIIGYLIWRK